MGASSSSSKSKPVDMTPQAFKDLQQPFANAISQLLSGANNGGIQSLLNGYQGPTTTPIGTNEKSILDKLMGIANSSPSTAAGGTPAAGTGTGVTDTSQGPVPTAPGTASPNQTPADNQAIKDLLSNTAASGSSADAVKGYVDQLGLSKDPKALQDFMAELNGASGTGAFSTDGNNPFLQSYIQAAQRQTQQALEETLGRTLPGRFALAGQKTQPGSSSAFDRAAAIATRGSADALGDIATNISYNAAEAARGREATALGDELGRRGTQDLQTQKLTSDAQQQQLDRALQAPQIEAGLQQAKTNDELTRAQTGKTQADTALTGQQVTSQQIDNLVQNLQAQALPRLINEMGIERGMQVFNDRINSLLSGLGIGAGTTRPVIANSSSSSSFGFNLK